jgi:hypothetical protein
VLGIGQATEFIPAKRASNNLPRVIGPRVSLLSLALTAAAVSLTACGGDDDDETTATTTEPPTAEDTGATGTTGSEGASATDCSARVDMASGESSGLEPDRRCGKKPPAVRITKLNEAADKAGCELRLGLPDEGNTHIPSSSDPEYDTNPPTSGPHDQVPLADGAYLDHPEERFYVHSMEHGRIVIHYDPKLAEKDQLALKGVFDDDPEGMVLIPSTGMPYEVAATAWRNGLGCESYSPEALDAIQDFRDQFRGKGPEKIPL